VSAAFAGALGIPTAAYTKATTPLGNGHPTWYVAGVGGSLWVTDVDPSSDASGLILPLNTAAHNASDHGADVRFGAPIFGATDPADAQAQQALDCYK
jgi:hypothetical protein